MATRRARRINQTFKRLPELQEALDDLLADVWGDGRKAGLAMKEVLRDAAEPIREDATRNVHVLTGETKAEIFADRGDPAKSSVIVGVDTKSAPQANWLEFGHAGPHAAPPYPFMRPAIESNRTKVRQIIADGFGKIVKKHA